MYTLEYGLDTNENRGGAYQILDDVLFETKYGQKSSRLQIESLGPQEPIENNVVSSWSAYLNFMEGKKNKHSPARLFFPMFEVDTKVFKCENAQTLEKFLEYVENAHSTYGGRSKLDEADINPAVSVIDSKKQVTKVATRAKKKVEDIDDIRVAAILHKKFGEYMLAINHRKEADIIEAQLVRGTFDWQTDKRSKDCGIFLMRHLESFMGIELGKWKCGLDVEGKKQNTQVGHLRNKYAARLLLSDCNIHNSKIRQEIGRMKSAVVNVKAIQGPQRRK
ncbi:hypothetical protein Tco_0206656 [Tanacetum coccineum]